MKYLKQALVTLSVMTLVFFGCKKEYSYEIPGGGTNGTAQWAFTEGTNSYKGPMDTAYIDTVGTTFLLNMEGKSADKKDNISLTVIADSVKVGTYQTPHCSFDYIHSGTNQYLSDINATGQFTLSITSIDSAYITGTFSGTALDTAKKPKTIVAGVFKVRFHSGIATVPVSTNCKVSDFVQYDSASGAPIFAIATTYNGNTVSKIDLIDSSVVPAIIDTTFNVTNTLGKIKVDAAGNQYFTVDGNGRAISFTGYADASNNNTPPAITAYTYDPAGHLIKRTEANRSTPSVIVIQVDYTWSNNLLTKAVMTYGGVKTVQAVYEYDAGKPVKDFMYLHPYATEIILFQSAVNLGVTCDQALVKVTETTYNLTTGQPNGTSTSILQNYVIDANKHVKSFVVSGDDFSAFDLPAKSKYKLTYHCF